MPNKKLPYLLHTRFAGPHYLVYRGGVPTHEAHAKREADTAVDACPPMVDHGTVKVKVIRSVDAGSPWLGASDVRL